MVTPAGQASVFRFGPFELNAANGQLCKAGRPVKIHPQPFRVLLLLAERSGQVVTREEIRYCLWGDHTAVEFDGGINFCVKQIRTALADDAENPRYVQTLPRRGYRFIASTTSVQPEPLALVAVPEPPRELTFRAAEESVANHDVHVPLTTLLQRGRAPGYAKVLGAILLLIVLLIAGTGHYFQRYFDQYFYHPWITQKDSVVLADFTNTTGDSAFDDALKQALAMELEQSPFLNLVPDAKVRHTLTMMGRPAVSELAGNWAVSFASALAVRPCWKERSRPLAVTTWLT